MSEHDETTRMSEDDDDAAVPAPSEGSKYTPPPLPNSDEDSALGDTACGRVSRGTSLRYHTTGHRFIQNWKTRPGSGETCYRATDLLRSLKKADDEELSASLTYPKGERSRRSLLLSRTYPRGLPTARRIASFLQPFDGGTDVTELAPELL